MPDPLRHEALQYAGREDFVASSVSVLRDGLDRDEQLIFLALAPKVDAVRNALGPDAADIALVATDEHGRNPARIMTMLHSFLGRADGRRVLAVNETVYPGRPPEVLLEAQLADSMLNIAPVHSWPISVICMYDVQSLDAAALAAMRRSHPAIRGEVSANPDYDADLLSTLHRAPFEPGPPAHAEHLEVTVGTQAVAREFVRSTADRFGIRLDRVDDLVLAAHEIMDGAFERGGGQCTLCLWSDGGSVWCEVTDRGQLLDPLLGRLTPDGAAGNGRGLWLAHHLCDLVQIRSSGAGTVVRLAMNA